MDNFITVVGNLTSDPELRFTPNGRAVANFTIAQTKKRKDGDYWVDAFTNFYRCTVWGSLAENVAETMQKGMRIMVQGEMVTETYTDKEGKEARSTNNINVSECGPSLKFATYKLGENAATRSGGNNGGGNGGYQQNQGGNNYPSQGGGGNYPAPNQGGYPSQGGGQRPPAGGSGGGYGYGGNDDEPPF